KPLYTSHPLEEMSSSENNPATSSSRENDTKHSENEQLRRGHPQVTKYGLIDNEDPDPQTARNINLGLADNEVLTTGQSLEPYLQSYVTIPPTSDHSFSWHRLWAFTGPGFLMSIAYLDPGNIESDLQAGAQTEYKLLWVLMWATILGLLMQRLAARLGVVTGLHLAELCYRRYPPVCRILLWIMVEIAIIGSDMQEVIGTAISIYLLSNGRIPIYVGVLITIIDTFTFLFLDKYGLRKLEAFFGFLISLMAATFGYQYYIMKPNEMQVIEGLIIPTCTNCNLDQWFKSISIIGSLFHCVLLVQIMPHNVFLHSALVKSRRIDRDKKEEVKDANRYVFVESAIALGASLLINIAVTAVFAQGLFQKSNHDIYQLCKNNTFAENVFPDKNTPVDINLHKYEESSWHLSWLCFGMSALYIWAIGIFASGQSSTMTGTYSGQFAMEGFLNLHWSRWKRVLLTRMIAIIGTIIIAFQSMDRLTEMNDFLNALMSLQLPFALFPLITFTSSRRVMGDFVNGFATKIIAFSISVIVISVNFAFVYFYVRSSISSSVLAYLLLVVYFAFYLLFLFYLLGTYLAVLGFEFVLEVPYVGKYFKESDYNEYRYS
ncbi:hypothetical protein TYRP_014570, partial [Tyrophagus putrescentiae]